MDTYKLTEVDRSKEANNKCIIYCITNIVNKKQYIGRTMQTFKKRMLGHLYDAQIKNSMYAIHCAIRKYGEESFTASILEICKSFDELREKEVHYIKLHDSFLNGYNMTLGGEGIVGFRHSEDVKLKISSLKKNIRINIETRKKLMKPVKQLELETGKIINQFESISEAEKITLISNIGMCCNGKIASAGGYFWRFCNSLDEMKCRWSNESKERMKRRLSLENSNFKSVDQIDMTTNLVIKTFDSLKSAKEETGATNISDVCRGIKKSSGGFKWCYSNK